MTTKVINQSGKYLDEPYRGQIIDAVHNSVDDFDIDGKSVSVVSVYTSDETKTIVVSISDD